jgi:hypothetical protein
MLGRYTECCSVPTFSFGLTPTKNIRAFLRYLSFEKIPSYGTNFTLVARGLAVSRSSEAPRSASQHPKAMAAQAIHRPLVRQRMASRPRILAGCGHELTFGEI